MVFHQGNLTMIQDGTTVHILTNYDDLYNRLNTDKILLNHQDIFSTETKEVLDNLILRNYNEDNLSIIPSCQGGHLKGMYYVGDVCPKCNTTVTSTVDDNLSFLLWLERPQDVQMFISPIIIAILLNRYKITKPNIAIIKYIMLPNFQFDRKQQKKNMFMLERLDNLLKLNHINKGYNSFVANFFKIIEILESEFVKEKASEKQVFAEFLQRNKEKIFSRYLGFPNKVMFAMDSNELGKFIDKSILNPINTIRRVTGIDLYTKPSAVKQAKVAKSLLDLADFYVKYIKSTFYSKPGLVRQHISSTRSHFTARAVITSIYGPHVYNEFHLPWSVGCSLFREHVLNRLYKRGFTYRTAVSLLMYHNRIYHPVLDEIFKEIIGEEGIRVFLNRNPSLHRGSIQTVVVTKVKTDPGDNTFSMSYLIGPSFNSDYDGDALNLYLPVTKKVRDNAVNFESHHNILALTGPNEFASNIKYPKTIVSTLANWFNS